jgi:hypothetical protein
MFIKTNPDSRREFLGVAAKALFAGILIQVTGCGSDYTTSSGSNAGAGDKQGVVGPPIQGHEAIIRKAVLDAGGELDLHIQGSATHDHVVSLSADDMAAITAGTQVAKQSSETNSHSHTVTFN